MNHALRSRRGSLGGVRLRRLSLLPLVVAAAACARPSGAAASAAAPWEAHAAPLAAAMASAAPTTVIVVRHAERAPVEGNDPPLAPIGGVRAEALRDALRAAGVTAVYTTQLLRTRLTADPLVRQLGLSPTIIAVAGPADVHAAEVARRVLAEQAGGVALVVGHSNTVPGIIRALGGISLGQLPDSAYDDLFIVNVPAAGAGATRMIHARYGPPNPAGSGGMMPH
jgi:phosphohistidine phosphatase SixA